MKFGRRVDEIYSSESDEELNMHDVPEKVLAPEQEETKQAGQSQKQHDHRKVTNLNQDNQSKQQNKNKDFQQNRQR